MSDFNYKQHPPSPEYDFGWDRIFNKKNIPNNHGKIIGEGFTYEGLPWIAVEGPEVTLDEDW